MFTVNFELPMHKGYVKLMGSYATWAPVVIPLLGEEENKEIVLSIESSIYTERMFLIQGEEEKLKVVAELEIHDVRGLGGTRFAYSRMIDQLRETIARATSTPAVAPSAVFTLPSFNGMFIQPTIGVDVAVNPSWSVEIVNAPVKLNPSVITTKVVE